MRTNPFKHWRMHLDLTRKELAAYVGCSEAFIIQCENGLYRNAPNDLAYALSKLLLTNAEFRAPFVARIVEDYNEWIYESRIASREIFRKLPSGMTVEGLIKAFHGKYALCQALRIQRSLLDAYLKNGWKSQVLNDAFLEVGYEWSRTKEIAG